MGTPKKKLQQTLCDRRSCKSQVFCLCDLDGFKITDSVNWRRADRGAFRNLLFCCRQSTEQCAAELGWGLDGAALSYVALWKLYCMLDSI